MSDDFRFGDPRGTDTSDDMGGCCGKPVGCRIESRGCLHKLEKADWQALADGVQAGEPAQDDGEATGA
jgi:hypothetical protein